MRRTFILSAVLSFAGIAHADTFNYLSFQSTDGTTQSVMAESLTMTFADSGEKLVANNGTETYSFDVANLSRMFFTTSNLTGISEVTFATSNGELQVYTLSGIYVGKFANRRTLDEAVEAGVYLVRQNGKTLKIAVR